MISRRSIMTLVLLVPVAAFAQPMPPSTADSIQSSIRSPTDATTPP